MVLQTLKKRGLPNVSALRESLRRGS